MPARALGFATGLTIPGNINLTQFVGTWSATSNNADVLAQIGWQEIT